MSEQKKICYVLSCYDAADHTHFAHIHDFIKELAKSAEIFLVVEKSNSDVKEIGEALGVKAEVLSRKEKTPNILINFFALLGARLNGWRDFYVHYSFLSAFNASLIVKIFGGRVFYWNCGLPWQYRRSLWRNSFEKLVYKMASYLVTGTASLRRQYAQHYGLSLNKIKIMPNWLSPEKFIVSKEAIEKTKADLGLKTDNKVLLFIHRLSKRKGAELLPKILKNVKVSANPVRNSKEVLGKARHVTISNGVKLIIIGDGPSRHLLEREFQEEIKQNRVKMLGWVPNQEIAKFYAIADVFLLPSEEEGFPRVILETMATGLPFVAFDVGGVKEIIPPQFLQNIVPAGDLEKFCNLVEENLSASQEEIVADRNIALAWVKKYETAVVAKKFLEMFN